MKLTVKVGERLFEVEVGDLRARPIVALVDGESFEVWPQAGPSSGLVGAAASPGKESGPPLPSPAAQPPRRSRRTAEDGTVLPSGGGQRVRAPLPGLIQAVSVLPGDTVQVGQELCVLEAMKMNNVIRSPQAGQVAEVRVVAGQQVKFNDVIVEFSQ